MQLLTVLYTLYILYLLLIINYTCMLHELFIALIMYVVSETLLTNLLRLLVILLLLLFIRKPIVAILSHYTSSGMHVLHESAYQLCTSLYGVTWTSKFHHIFHIIKPLHMYA